MQHRVVPRGRGRRICASTTSSATTPRPPPPLTTSPPPHRPPAAPVVLGGMPERAAYGVSPRPRPHPPRMCVSLSCPRSSASPTSASTASCRAPMAPRSTSGCFSQDWGKQIDERAWVGMGSRVRRRCSGSHRGRCDIVSAYPVAATPARTRGRGNEGAHCRYRGWGQAGGYRRVALVCRGVRGQDPCPPGRHKQAERRGLNCTTTNALLGAALVIQHTRTATAARRRLGAAARPPRRSLRCHSCGPLHAAQRGAAHSVTDPHLEAALAHGCATAIEQAEQAEGGVGVLGWRGGEGRGPNVWVGQDIPAGGTGAEAHGGVCVTGEG